MSTKTNVINIIMKKTQKLPCFGYNMLCKGSTHWIEDNICFLLGPLSNAFERSEIWVSFKGDCSLTLQVISILLDEEKDQQRQEKADNRTNLALSEGYSQLTCLSILKGIYKKSTQNSQVFCLQIYMYIENVLGIWQFLVNTFS